MRKISENDGEKPNSHRPKRVLGRLADTLVIRGDLEHTSSVETDDIDDMLREWAELHR